MAYVVLDDIRSAECPKSALLRNPESDELVRIFAQADSVGESALGAAHSWPGVFYDSFRLLKGQKERDERAQERAIHKAASS